MAWPNDALTIITELQIGGSWVDISGDVRTSDNIKISRGRRNEGSKVDHAKCTVKVNNRHGRYSPRNPNSPYFEVLGRNTPLRVSVVLPGGALSHRFTGGVAAWPQHWDLSDTDVWVPVQAAGILRRLDQATPPLRDALRRHITSGGPLAYWPLTDGEDARQGSEVAAGGQPMRTIGDSGSFFQGQVGWGKGELAGWLAPVVDIPSATTGLLVASVPSHPVTSWAVDHFRTGTASDAGLQLTDTGQRTDADPLVRWEVQFFGPVGGATPEAWVTVTAFGDTSSDFAFLTTLVDPGIDDGGAHHIRLGIADDGGGGSDWELVIDGVVRASGNHTAPCRPLRTVRYSWSLRDPEGNDTGPLSVGHIAYWGETPPDASATHTAMQGHTRELAGRRIERLCAEQDVPLQVHGSLDDTPPMGPQRAGRFLELLGIAADVDGGVLGEARDELALEYRTRTSKYQGV